MGGPAGFSETFEGVLSDTVVSMSPGMITLGYDPNTGMATWSGELQTPSLFGIHGYAKYSGTFHLRNTILSHTQYGQALLQREAGICGMLPNACGG
ncbi:hypothetical protein ACWXWU_11105 [Shewanella sp. A14]